MPTNYQPPLRIVTRKSPLALWQANHVKTQLEAAHPDLQVDIIGIMTEGDRLLATPLTQIGGKGLFVKELEKALLERRADIAVHSIKDMPAQLPDKLILAAVCQREDPRDAFLSPLCNRLIDLPQGAIVGTASSRRTSLLKALRPDLTITNLRGNVGTRLRRLEDNQFDAIILAAAGLVRLQATDRIREYLDPEFWIPAVGQGAIGIECHAENQKIRELLTALEDPTTRHCITAERSMNQALGGGCQFPIAAYATYAEEQLTIRGLVGEVTTGQLINARVTGPFQAAKQLGQQLAQELLALGANNLLKNL